MKQYKKRYKRRDINHLRRERAIRKRAEENTAFFLEAYRRPKEMRRFFFL